MLVFAVFSVSKNLAHVEVFENYVHDCNVLTGEAICLLIDAPHHFAAENRALQDVVCDHITMTFRVKVLAM